jgi:hypothetical protein
VRTALLALGFAAVLAPSTLPAQFVIKGGLSFASATESDYLPEVNTRTGFAVGLSLGLPFGQIASLRPEVLYVQKGGTLANDGTFKLDELNVPLFLQLSVPIPVLSPFVLVGPQAEYELSCTRLDVDCVDTKTLRWGFAAGAGVYLGGFSVEGRYDWTLTSLSDDIHSKPRTIMLLVGLGGR